MQKEVLASILFVVVTMVVVMVEGSITPSFRNPIMEDKYNLHTRTKRLGCSRKPLDGSSPSRILSKEPWKYVAEEDLPEHFDWRSNDNKQWLIPIQNQLMPKFCGSCWAFATTSALSDRFKIASNATTPDIILSPQALLDCGSEYGAGTCDGGSKASANQFMNQYGVTDITCAPYLAVDYAYQSELPCQETMCRQCDRFGNCFSVPNAPKYFVDEYGDLPTLNVGAMMAEIYTRGPIVCCIYAHSASFENYTSGVIQDPTVYPECTHDISLVGWGVQRETGLKYWIGRNSFGTIWGESGWFKLERGTNALLVEADCSWATPKV